jgi:hypothetical protein
MRCEWDGNKVSVTKKKKPSKRRRFENLKVLLAMRSKEFAYKISKTKIHESSLLLLTERIILVLFDTTARSIADFTSYNTQGFVRRDGFC